MILACILQGIFVKWSEEETINSAREISNSDCTTQGNIKDLFLPSSLAKTAMWNLKASSTSLSRLSFFFCAVCPQCWHYKRAACDHPSTRQSSRVARQSSGTTGAGTVPLSLTCSPQRLQKHIISLCSSFTSHCNHFLHRHRIYIKGFPQLSSNLGCRPIL